MSKRHKFTLLRVRHPALLLPKMAKSRRFSANHFSLVWGCVLLGKNDEDPDKPYGTKVRFGHFGCCRRNCHYLCVTSHCAVLSCRAQKSLARILSCRDNLKHRVVIVPCFMYHAGKSPTRAGGHADLGWGRHNACRVMFKVISTRRRVVPRAI